MFCPNCGKQIGGDDKFCNFCGKEISGESAGGNGYVKVFNRGYDYCQLCGDYAPIKYIEFYQNVGMLLARQSKSIKGKLCKNCINKNFWDFTLTTLVLGWWGVISLLITPFYILNNIFRYLTCLRLKAIKKEKSYSIESNFSRRAKNFFSEKSNYLKLLKYSVILLVVVFFVWIISSNDYSNDGGTKTPLPTPIQQVSDDNVEFIPTLPAVSLTNGTILKKNSVYLRGDGKLHIKNGTSLDALAKLIRGGTSILTVYVKANSNYTMTGVSDGIYWLAFAQGVDWDSTTQKFRRNTQYSSFDETFDFNTTEDYQYIYYPEFEVTLHPVVGGTAETSSVDPAQFNAY